MSMSSHSKKRQKTTTAALSNNTASQKLSIAKPLPVTRGGWRVEDGLKHLMSVDPAFEQIIANHDLPNTYTTYTPSESGDEAMLRPFHSLMMTIIFQQLHGKAAQTIADRFVAALGLDENGIVTPEHINEAEFKVELIEGKRKILVNGVICGLSERKSQYIQSLAEHFSDEMLLKSADFQTMDDETIFRKLTQVKGLGNWSVHMFMIFKLHRPDVLPTGDLAVRKGICMLYGMPAKALEGGKKGEDKAKELCSHWSPYSSLASSYMWRLSDTVLVSDPLPSVSTSASSSSSSSSTSKKSKKGV